MNSENFRPRGLIKENFIKARGAIKWRNAKALIFTAFIAAIDARLKGGWAIKEGDVRDGLISVGVIIVFVPSMMYLIDRLSPKGKFRAPTCQVGNLKWGICKIN